MSYDVGGLAVSIYLLPNNILLSPLPEKVGIATHYRGDNAFSEVFYFFSPFPIRPWRFHPPPPLFPVYNNFSVYQKIFYIILIW